MKNFKIISFDDYKALKPFFENQPYELSVYSLASIICWNTAVASPYYKVDGDTLLLSHLFEKEKEHDHLMLPIRRDKMATPSELAGYAEKYGYSSYWFVPENYISCYGIDTVSELFDIEEQPEYEDYVYLSEDLATLKGNKLMKKRNHFNYFKKNYIDTGLAVLHDMTPDSVENCLDYLEEWCLERDCGQNPESSMLCEKNAASNAIQNLEHLEMKGLVLRVEGKINAIAVASRISDRMGALHFEKAVPTIKGLYQYFDSKCAETLFSGLEYLNKESDMGQPGLEKAKKSYYPVMRIKSYKLTIKRHL